MESDSFNESYYFGIVNNLLRHKSINHKCSNLTLNEVLWVSDCKMCDVHIEILHFNNSHTSLRTYSKITGGYPNYFVIFPTGDITNNINFSKVKSLICHRYRCMA